MWKTSVAYQSRWLAIWIRWTLCWQWWYFWYFKSENSFVKKLNTTCHHCSSNHRFNIKMLGWRDCYQIGYVSLARYANFTSDWSSFTWCYLMPRTGSPKGGGVLICVSSSVPSHLIISHSTIDFVAIQLLTSPPVTLCCIYIPPSCCLELPDQNVIILDLPDINWSCLTSPLPTSNLLCDLVFKFNLTQLIHDATHIKENILTPFNYQHWQSDFEPKCFSQLWPFLHLLWSFLQLPSLIIMLPNICLTILMVTLKPSTSIFSTLITPSVPPAFSLESCHIYGLFANCKDPIPKWFALSVKLRVQFFFHHSQST